MAFAAARSPVAGGTPVAGTGVPGGGGRNCGTGVVIAARLRGHLRGGGSSARRRLNQRRRPAQPDVLLRADVHRRQVVDRQLVRPHDVRRQQHDDVGLAR